MEGRGGGSSLKYWHHQFLFSCALYAIIKLFEGICTNSTWFVMKRDMPKLTSPLPLPNGNCLFSIIIGQRNKVTKYLHLLRCHYQFWAMPFFLHLKFFFLNSTWQFHENVSYRGAPCLKVWERLLSEAILLVKTHIDFITSILFPCSFF